MQIWIVVYAIGAAQAALLAVALWRRPANVPANHVLAAWIGLVALDLAVKAAYIGGDPLAWLKAYQVVALFPFFYASFFYVYVRALTTGRGVSWRDVMHLAGFVVALGIATPWLLHGDAGAAAMVAIGRAIGLPPVRIWDDSLLLAYAFAYIFAALACIGRYRRRLRGVRADADRQSMRWLGALAVGQLVIWSIAGVQDIIDLPHVDYYLIYGAVAAWVLVVGWFSLAQPPVPTLAAADADAVDEPDSTNGSEVECSVDGSTTHGAGEAGAAHDARFPEVETRLARLMADDALYREPALTIGQLARRSGYPEYLVSAVINRRFGGNFWDYVNRHRVEAVRACLANPGDARTILDIAYASGFTAKSTFNTAFKRAIGQTPSAYRAQVAATYGVASAAGTRTPPG